MLNIISNGSKWAGQPEDPIEKLYEVLETLDPSFEDYGNFIDESTEWLGEDPYPGKKVVVFFGNFWKLSHVFNIHTDEPEVIEKLTRLIRANQATPEYAKAKIGAMEFRSRWSRSEIQENWSI
jgi:hypothetical protein